VVLKLDRANLPQIPADSSVQMTSDTLIGDKFVDISSGRSPAHVQPGSELIYQEQTDLMKSLDLQQFEKNLRIVDAMLTDIEQGRSRVGQLVLGDQLYRDLGKRIGEIQAGFHEASSVTSALGREVYGDPLYRAIREPLVGLDQTLAQLQAGQGAGGKFLRDPAAYDGLVSSVVELRKQVADLGSSPFLSSDTAYQDWTRGIESLIRQVEEFNANPLLSTSATYDNLNGFARELAGTLKDFRENPKKYLRLKVF